MPGYLRFEVDEYVVEACQELPQIEHVVVNDRTMDMGRRYAQAHDGCGRRPGFLNAMKFGLSSFNGVE